LKVDLGARFLRHLIKILRSSALPSFASTLLLEFLWRMPRIRSRSRSHDPRRCLDDSSSCSSESSSARENATWWYHADREDADARMCALSIQAARHAVFTMRTFGPRCLGLLVLLRFEIRHVNGDMVRSFPDGLWFRPHDAERDGPWPLSHDRGSELARAWALQHDGGIRGRVLLRAVGPGSVAERIVVSPNSPIYEGP